MEALDLALWGGVVVLALYAAKLTIPEPPSLEWARFFQLAVSTLVRGELDRAGGEFEDWEREVGELLPSTAGWDLLCDPADLGEDFDLQRGLGKGRDWEALAGWSEDFAGALSKRFVGVRFAFVGEAGGLDGVVDGLAEAVGGEIAVVSSEGSDEELAERLGGLLGSLEERLVVLCAGGGAGCVARGLHASPGLRDRVRAVVAVEPTFDEWFEEGFTHEAMDTEIARSTAWVSVGFGGEEPKWWPEPELPESGRRSIESVSLGFLVKPLDEVDAAIVGRGLAVTLNHWLNIAT